MGKEDSKAPICMAIVGVFVILLAGFWIWPALKPPALGWKDCKEENKNNDMEELIKCVNSTETLPGYWDTEAPLWIPMWVFRLLSITLAVLTFLGGVVLIIGIIRVSWLYAVYVVIGIFIILITIAMITLLIIVVVGAYGNIDSNTDYFNGLCEHCISYMEGNTRKEVVLATRVQMKLVFHFARYYNIEKAVEELKKAKGDKPKYVDLTTGNPQKKIVEEAKKTMDDVLGFIKLVNILMLVGASLYFFIIIATLSCACYAGA